MSNEWSQIGVILLGGGITLVFTILGLWLWEKYRTKAIRPPLEQNPIINVDLNPIYKILDDLPNKVLQSIQSSSNTYKGAVAELVGYMKLYSTYDRVIPLNNIVDFICIKFPTKTEEGRVDLVDIKTGDNSRLSKEQRMLKKLIDEHKINFIKLKINTAPVEDDSTNTTE